MSEGQGGHFIRHSHKESYDFLSLIKIEESRKNLLEAVELFLETASPEEVNQRMHSEVYVTQFEVTSA